MNILLVSPFENHATGRGDRNLRLHRELLSRGHTVEYVTANFDHASKSHIARERLSESPGLRVLRVPGYNRNVGLARVWCHVVFAIKLWFVSIGKRWDAVVISSIPPEALLSALLLRKRALIVDIRDIWPDALQAYGRPTPAMRAFGSYCDAIYRLTLRAASRIMMVAPGFASWLKRYGAFEHRRVKFVPLGFRREDFRPLSSGGTKYDFCYAGGATPQFDIREFSGQFGDQCGIVLGSGPLLDEWREAFPKTEFRGAVPRSEAMSVMGKSRQLLFPSNPFAQLPNKAFDYFALGHEVALGERSSRSTRSLLALRKRRDVGKCESWEVYRSIEKEALAKRAADIIEGTMQ